jgi:hypothetical protein
MERFKRFILYIRNVNRPAALESAKWTFGMIGVSTVLGEIAAARVDLFIFAIGSLVFGCWYAIYRACL